MKLSVQPVMRGVYRFCEDHPEAPVDAYLVIGSEAALMIDTLESVNGVWDEVRRLTQLPVAVAITHGHCDHAGEALQEFIDAGCTIYMDPADLEPLMQTTGRAYNPHVFTPFPDAIDLGGVALEVLDVVGHTMGSKVFLDRERALLFTGDAVGSGDFWMQLGHSAPLGVFAEQLRGLMEKVAGLHDLVIMPGHAYQQPRPLGFFYLWDVLTACRNVLEGRADTADLVMTAAGERLVYRTIGHGSLGCMCYNPYKL
ncbi:MAG: MBL fold metallo-hydrolase [Clostridia bacterium]|nr:MBL fold metallo-hydrolase [Clostridia bacterium]